MKKKLLEILKNWPKNYISILDLKYRLCASSDAISSLLKRAVKDGSLIRLKRDFYIITSKGNPNTFELAALMYGPSYISIESSLSFHGWIPESVPTICSMCTKKPKILETPLGIFTYYNVPTKIFHVGLTNINGIFFMAEPWKALADLIYLKKRKWISVLALSNDLRIDVEVIQNSNLELLQILATTYPNNRTKSALKILLKDLTI